MATVGEKSFACTHQGCAKRFTRAEHLHRHALNHNPGGSTCSLCRAHFKRPDLLKRHMDRHRQKDLEAGGPGCGVLDTRKRSWRALDGSVVQKRPCPKGLNRSSRASSERSEPEAQQEPSPESEPAESDPLGDLSFGREADASLVLDIRSGPHGSSIASSAEFSNTSPMLEAIVPTQQQDPSLAYAQSWTDLLHSRVLDEALGTTAEQGQYDSIFQPDTASSFNMPYTTALDYNWLFNAEKSPAFDVALPANQSPNLFEQGMGVTQQQQTAFAVTPESMGTSSSRAWSDTEKHDPKPQSHVFVDANTHAQTPRSLANKIVPTTLEVYPERRPRRNMADPPAGAQKNWPSSAHAVPIEFERPLSTLRRPLPLPEITEVQRERLLKIITSANPTLPDQRHTLHDHPLLSVPSLQSYQELFFTHFNTAYPLIHLATFNIHHDEPLLLLSVILLGATYSSKDAHQLAVCIHDVIRPSIFAHAGFSPRPELWTLQCILLVECFGKSRAGQKQHDMSHLFHGLLINLIRRSDCQSIRPTGPPPGSGEDNMERLDRVWRRWAEAESKKRLALLCFMWDTQHAVLFCQSLCMSSFELRLELPCSQSIWEARDATSWVSAWRSTLSTDHRTLYLPTLKSYLTSNVPRPTGLGALSRILILHGLMSIAWDMQRRDQTSLGVISDGNASGGRDSSWRNLLSKAYHVWKVDFDAYCTAAIARFQRGPQGQHMSGGSPQDDEETQRNEFMAFAAAYKAVYHSAQVLLNMEFLDVQIYAGARHILGRPVQQKDYLRSAQVVKRWASQSTASPSASKDSEAKTGEHGLSNQSASTAAWHAARMLRESMATLIESDAMNLFHVPWCLYLVTLTCWAYHHARSSRSRRGADEDDDGDGGDFEDDDEMVWDPHAEMKGLLASMSESVKRKDSVLAWEKRRTNGLVWIMADALTKVRWGIVHSGVVVLRGLVPQRLINQYDEYED